MYSSIYIALGNIAAQNQAAQQSQAQAQSGAGNPTIMVPNPPGSVPSIAVGAASLVAAALVKGQQHDVVARQQAPGKINKVLGVIRVSSLACC